MQKIFFWLRRVQGTRVTATQSPFIFNRLSQGRTKVSVLAQNNLFAMPISRRRRLASRSQPSASGHLIASCFLRGPKNVNLWFPYLQLDVKLLRLKDCRIVYHEISTSQLNRQFNDRKIVKIACCFSYYGGFKQFNLKLSFTVRVHETLNICTSVFQDVTSYSLVEMQ